MLKETELFHPGLEELLLDAQAAVSLVDRPLLKVLLLAAYRIGRQDEQPKAMRQELAACMHQAAVELR